MTKMLTGIDVNHTELLFSEVLKVILNFEERVMFLTRPGKGRPVIQRCRVMLSRSRKRNMAKGKKVLYFRLNSTVHPWTDLNGARHDCVVMWCQKTDQNTFDEILEDILVKDVA